MSLNTLFGINGAGKDTVAHELCRTLDRDLVLTSMSRMCMYLLDITDSYDVRNKVDPDAYRQLEQVSQPEMIKLEQGPYRNLIEKLAEQDSESLVLSHLITSLHLGERVVYLTDRLTPDWYIESNSALVQLKSDPKVILERRKKDAEQGIRTRPLDLDQIVTHQQLCDEEWDRISEGVIKPKKGMYVVENYELDDTVALVKEAIYG